MPLKGNHQAQSESQSFSFLRIRHISLLVSKRELVIRVIQDQAKSGVCSGEASSLPKMMVPLVDGI